MENDDHCACCPITPTRSNPISSQVITVILSSPEEWGKENGKKMGGKSGMSGVGKENSFLQ